MTYRCSTRECDGQTTTEDGECDYCQSEASYWSSYFGRNESNPTTRREILEAMRPYSKISKGGGW